MHYKVQDQLYKHKSEIFCVCRDLNLGGFAKLKTTAILCLQTINFPVTTIKFPEQIQNVWQINFCQCFAKPKATHTLVVVDEQNTFES